MKTSFFSKGSSSLPKPHDEASLQAWIVAALAKRLRLDPETIDPTAPFADYGLDSLVAIRLTSNLETALSTKLEPTLLWEHPNIAALVQHLAKEVGFQK